MATDKDLYKTIFKSKPISLVQQRIALMKSFPEAECSVKKDTLHWRGILSPTLLSKEYPVEVIYRLKKSPRIFVQDDTIETLDTNTIPHKFYIDKESNKIAVCLFTDGEFTSHKWINKTIIPWTIEWLFHYEIWQATGNWCGGGKHPHKNDYKKQDQFIKEFDDYDQRTERPNIQNPQR